MSGKKSHRIKQDIRLFLYYDLFMCPCNQNETIRHMKWEGWETLKFYTITKQNRPLVELNISVSALGEKESEGRQ